MDNLLIIFAKYPESGSVKTRLGKGIGYQEAARLYETLLRELIEGVTPCSAEKENCNDIGGHNSGYDLNLFVDDRHSLDAYRLKLGSHLIYVHQKGSDLGEKMIHAFDHAFKRGYERVVLMGSDIPMVDSKAIVSFFEDLTKDQMVIGPTTDGGYYAIGFKKGVDYRPIFQGIPWSTDSVFKITVNKAISLGIPHTIETERFDIDTVEDLLRYNAFISNLCR